MRNEKIVKVQKGITEEIGDRKIMHRKRESDIAVALGASVIEGPGNITSCGLVIHAAREDGNFGVLGDLDSTIGANLASYTIFHQTRPRPRAERRTVKWNEGFSLSQICSCHGRISRPA